MSAGDYDMGRTDERCSIDPLLEQIERLLIGDRANAALYNKIVQYCRNTRECLEAASAVGNPSVKP
jgi:hypothetical protein